MSGSAPASGFLIREVEQADEPALAALERAAPDTGRLALRVTPRVRYLELAARYPGVRGYVALASDPPWVVGMLLGSLAPTQLNGTVVPGVYLFSLRVHPDARRRGIGSALLAHAWERARAEAGAEVAWGAAMEGNEASLRAFARAGFARLRDIAIQFLLPALGRPSHRAVSIRPATPADLPELAGALNGAHAPHNFWRPCTPESLAAELLGARHSLDDVTLALDPNGALLAAGAVFDLGRVADLRLLGHRHLPDHVNRLLAPLLARLPLRPLLLRHRLLSPAHSEAGLALLRSIQPRAGGPLSALAIPLDPRDPAWPIVARPWGLARRLHVLATSVTPVQEDRPMYLA